MIYKHAISTVVPARNAKLPLASFEGQPGARQGVDCVKQPARIPTGEGVVVRGQGKPDSSLSSGQRRITQDYRTSTTPRCIPYGCTCVA